MSFLKNLRAKILLWSLIPAALALVAVALIALFAYEGMARNIVQQRDTELAKVSAARLSEGLTLHSGILQTAADDADLQSLEPARIGRALERVQIELFAFDAGVVIYSDQGVAVGSDPFAFNRRGEDFPVRSEFDKARNTRRPSFSNVFEDAISGEEVILVTVPIVASGNEFKGVLAGMSTLESLVSDVTYSKVLEITAGRKGFAYLVDGQGQTIYHRDTSLLGKSLSANDPVTRATKGETGAVIADGPSGESVMSGFAPVPDTDFSIEWAVITQDRWEDVVGPIRSASRLMLGLLVLGAVLASELVFFAIGRVLKPVKDLTEGAKHIAGGDFDYSIVNNSGDEIQELAQQFTMMADALKESYAGLEQKVEARTEELLELNQTLGALIEASPLAIGVLDRDSKLRSWNKAGERMFGWTEAEALTQPGPILSTGEDRDEAMARQRRVLSGESLLGIELHHRKKDGSLIDVEVWAAPLRDAHGEISGGIIIYADITERNSALEALRQAEEKYRSIFENSVEGIFHLTPRGEIISGNPALARIFGFDSPEEITATRLEEQHTHPEHAYFHEFGHLIREKGSVSGYEVQERRQDGSPMWVSINARAVDDQRGELAFYEGTVQDITEHKLAEEALRESEERYRNLVETAQDIIYTLSIDGTITSLNHAFETTTGWSRSEWLGKPVTDLIHPDDLEPGTDLVQRFSRGGRPPRFELRVLNKSGEYLNCEFLTTPQMRDGAIIGIVGIGRDVTERKEAEQTLLEQTRELAVLEERNRFAREIHDTLAQGFTGIVLQLEAAEQVLGASAPEVQDHMARAKGLARDSLQEARRSVWDLLPKALEQLPLDTAIREEVHRRFNGQGSFNVSGEQRPLSSSVQTALLRICQEALTNISRHAAATRVSVKMDFQVDAVHLEVRDNGIGFDRAGNGDSQDQGGGFGLLGMEQRARQLGGTILVSSEKGKGTVVETRIPTAEAARDSSYFPRGVIGHGQYKDTHRR